MQPLPLLRAAASLCSRAMPNRQPVELPASVVKVLADVTFIDGWNERCPTIRLDKDRRPDSRPFKKSEDFVHATLAKTTAHWYLCRPWRAKLGFQGVGTTGGVKLTHLITHL